MIDPFSIPIKHEKEAQPYFLELYPPLLPFSPSSVSEFMLTWRGPLRKGRK